MNTTNLKINTNKSNIIRRFKESFSSPLMLGEPRTIGSVYGSYMIMRQLFGEKPLCKWDILIHNEAICKLTEDEEGNTTLSYRIIRGYLNPIKIFLWYVVLFIPIFMTIASNDMLKTISPFILYVVPAIPVTTGVIVTNICSRVCHKSDNNIKELIENITYEAERINKYPKFDVK